MSDIVYTIEEVAKMLKVSQMTVRRLIDEVVNALKSEQLLPSNMRNCPES